MLKSVAKWCLAGVSALMVVVFILTLFTVFATPLKEQLSDYFLGYFDGGAPEEFYPDLPPLPLPPDSPESWADPATEPEHCEFNISGRITRNDGAPIVAAEVKIYNAGMYDMGDYRFTNSNGEFSYTEIGMETCDKEGFYLSISKNGFEPHFMIAEPDDEINISLGSIYY